MATKPLLVESPVIGSPPIKPISKTKIWIFVTVMIIFIIAIYVILAYALNIWPFTEKPLETKQYPNIIFITMDDLGFTDNPYYSSLSNNFRNENQISFSMPNLEFIAQNAIRLNYHYSESQCSPTRSSMLTGMYAWKTGVVYPVSIQTSSHTDRNLTLLPEYLSNSNADYTTLLIGKWHIGASSIDYLPFNRGFNSKHNLFMTGAHGYFYHKFSCSLFSRYDATSEELDINITTKRNKLFGNQFCSYDFFNNDGILYDGNNTYIETLFAKQAVDFIENAKVNDNDQPYFMFYQMPTPHFPLTTPPEYDLNNNIIDYSNCDNIINDDNGGLRILFCKMCIYVDTIIGFLLDGIDLNETIIIITSDNGGQPRGASVSPAVLEGDTSAGQNLPLRGVKATAFEGGIRTGAFIYGGFGYNITHQAINCDYNHLFHVSDWISTIMNMIEIEYDKEKIESKMDGINLWDDIKNICFHSNNNKNNSEDRVDVQRREEIISVKMCNDGTFGSTYIRKNGWKLVINGTRTRCQPRYTTDDNISYYMLFDESYSIIPNRTWYLNFNTSYTTNDLFRSECYDSMSEIERSNDTNFLYEEIMLFDIDNDRIEACNVANENTDIVDELLLYLNQQIALNGYNGGRQMPPTTFSVYSQLNEGFFVCETNLSFLTQWQDLDEIEISWNSVWTKAIDFKENCTL